MKKAKKMKAINIINALNKYDQLLEIDVIIKDSFGNYSSIHDISMEKDGELIITIDNKHYIRKVSERKAEISESRKY